MVGMSNELALTESSLLDGLAPELFSIGLADYDRVMAERSLYHFVQQAWPHIRPGVVLELNWHIEAICENLEAATAGIIKRLCINQPPRSLKSICVSVCWPCWSWIAKPETQWMFASYAETLSTRDSVMRRSLISSEWYQKNWGHIVQLSSDQNLKTEFANTRRGIMTSTSVGGSSIGKGGEILVLDDPMNPQEASSDAERMRTNNWIRSSFLNRLNNPMTGVIVNVMQRLHENDPTGMFLEMGGWELLCLPGEAEEYQEIVFPISGKIVERQVGDLLFPSRLSKEVLEKAKIEYGSYGYAGQIQQRPSPAEGGMLKRQWWRFWYPRGSAPPEPVSIQLSDGSYWICPQEELPDKFDESLLSWDLSFKGLATSDYVVGQYWRRLRADKFLVMQVRRQADFPTTISMIKAMSVECPEADCVLVEDKANGPAVIDTLRREISGFIAVNPAGGKETRVNAVSPSIEAGNVYLPHPTLFPWVGDFIERASAFPNAKYDDEIDCSTQALVRMGKHYIEWQDTPEPELTDEEKWEEMLLKYGEVPKKVTVATGW